MNWASSGGSKCSALLPFSCSPHHLNLRSCWSLATSRQAWHPVSRSRVGRRSEEHTSELQSLMRISYAVFCLKKKKNKKKKVTPYNYHTTRTKKTNKYLNNI